MREFWTNQNNLFHTQKRKNSYVLDTHKNTSTDSNFSGIWPIDIEFSRIWPIFSSFPKFGWLSPSFHEFSRFMSSFPKFGWLSSRFSRIWPIDSMLPNLADWYRVFPNLADCFTVFPNLDDWFRFFTNLADSFWVFYEFSRFILSFPRFGWLNPSFHEFGWFIPSFWTSPIYFEFSGNNAKLMIKKISPTSWSRAGLKLKFFFLINILNKTKEPILAYYLPIVVYEEKKVQIYSLPKGISANWNANNQMLDFNTTITVMLRVPLKNKINSI